MPESAIESAKQEILQAIEKKRQQPSWWDVASLLLPILLGFLIWVVQKDIEAKIETSTTHLETRLAVTEEFYKKKLTVYEDVYKNAALLIEAVREARVPAQGTQALNQRLSAFYQSYNVNWLYVSSELRELLDRLWLEIATQDPPEVSTQEIRRLTDEIEQRMRRDLHVPEIGSITDSLWRDEESSR